MSDSSPVVLVHGLVGRFGGDEVLAQLQPASVFMPHLMGYGGVPRADEPLSIDSQAQWLGDEIARRFDNQAVRLVGHSVGAVVAAAFARRHLERVVSFVNVEGNFALADAFMSARLAAMSRAEVAALVERDRSDPAGWLREADIDPAPEAVRQASDALHYQSGETIQQMAAAVVEFTSGPAYEELLREVFAGTAVCLMSGEKSRRGWNVPEWALAAARGYVEVPGSGHFLAIEQPTAFGRAIAEFHRSATAHAATSGALTAL